MCDHENREAAMTVIERDETGKPTVWCDPCLAPLIAALNTCGLSTVASCCGHHKQLGRISLTDGRDLIVTDYETATAMFARQGVPVPPLADHVDGSAE